MSRRITFGALLAAVVGLLSTAERIFDWLARIDFVVSRQADPGWLGAVSRLLLLFPATLASLPFWAPWVVLIVGLGVIGWDSHSVAARKRESVVVAAQAVEPERDKHLRIVKWLTGKFSGRSLQVQRAALFGSVVHEHYPTSDVDLIVLFNPRSDRQITKLVKKIKSEVAREFYTTFGHPLHVTFFCAHEQRDMCAFMTEAGRYEVIVGNSDDSTLLAFAGRNRSEYDNSAHP